MHLFSTLASASAYQSFLNLNLSLNLYLDIWALPFGIVFITCLLPLDNFVRNIINLER
jgi:hypothetical protein